MICSNCGCQHEDELAVCPQCGMDFNRNPLHPVAVQPLYSTDPVINAIKSLGASGGFLAGTIAYTLALIVTILSSVDVSFQVYEQKVNRVTSITAIVSLWSGLLPALFIAVGLWMTYASARDRTSNGMQTRGLTIIRGVMIFWRSIMGIALIGLVLGILMGNSTAWRDVPWSKKLTVLFLVIAVLMTALVYYITAAHTIGVIREAVKKGIALTEGVSTFVAVVNIIVGVMIPLACIVITAKGMYVFSSAPVDLFLSLCTAVSHILFGVYMLLYKRKLEPHRHQSPPPVQTDVSVGKSG